MPLWHRTNQRFALAVTPLTPSVLAAQGIDHLTAPEDFEADYSWTDGLCGLVSAVAFLVDFASDVFLSSAMEDDPLAEYWSKATLLLARECLLGRSVTGNSRESAASAPVRTPLILRDCT